MLRGARTLLRLRIEIADRDAELRARFENFQPDDLQREILLVGALDEAIERRILERPPPARFNVALRHALVAALDPIVLNGRLRGNPGRRRSRPAPEPSKSEELPDKQGRRSLDFR